MRAGQVMVLLFCLALATLLVFEPTVSGGSAFRAELVAADGLPQELSDQVFWQLINDFSENEGYFPADNFVSNEAALQEVIPELSRNTKTGGVYLGVGPDQNFTYIAALQPKIAFIVDIRRQNMIQHLMYKALFELSTNRAEFLAQLFSRPRPASAVTDSTAEELFAAFKNVESDEGIFRDTLTSIKKNLIETHGFVLTARDEGSLHHVLEAFFREGPNLTYDSRNGHFRTQQSPTYADLLMQTDRVGQNRSYIATEENFRFVQDLEKRNLIVPVVGDFAGEKALRSVAEYLNFHQAAVSAFYVSNVEQYLFQQPNGWRNFYQTLQALPIDSSSLLIRSVFSRGVIIQRRRGRLKNNSLSLLSTIDALVRAFNGGAIKRYDDIIKMSR